MSTRQPSGNYNSNSDAFPSSGGPTRPNRGGTGRVVNFPVVDNSNSAQKIVPTPSYLNPRGTVDAPITYFGSTEKLPSSALGRMFTGIGNAIGETAARPNTGLGGMSQAALAQISSQMYTPAGVTMQMPGTIPQPGRHEPGGEWGVPSFKGFGAMNSFPGVTMFRTGAVTPTSRDPSGMIMNGFAPRPTELDSQRSIHGVPNPDPRFPGSLTGRPNGSPLASAVTPSTSNADELTERKPYEEVNPNVVKQFIIRPFAPNFSPGDCTNQIMIVHRSTAELNNDDSNVTGGGSRIKRYFRGPSLQAPSQAGARFTMINMTGFNYMCAANELASSKATAFDLMANWEIQGVVLNDSPMDVVNQANRSLESAVERIAVLTVAGKTPCFNYWGKGALKSSAKLYLVLKRVPRTELVELSQFHPAKSAASRRLEIAKNSRLERAPVNPTSSTLYYKTDHYGQHLAVPSISENGQQLHTHPFQFMPYVTDSFRGVPLDVLRYTNPDGTVDFGIAYEIGYTREAFPGQGDPDNYSGSVMSVSKLFESGTLYIDVKIETLA